MCGRTVFTFDTNVKRLLDIKWEFQVDRSRFGVQVVPGGLVNAVVQRPTDGELGLCSFRWEWQGESGQYFNARIESAHQKPMWADAFESTRAVMVLSSFFERGVEFSYPDNASILVAALYKTQPLRMITMCTRPADLPVSVIHDRMPVVLPSLSDATRWLDPTLSRSEVVSLATRLTDEPVTFARAA